MYYLNRLLSGLCCVAILGLTIDSRALSAEEITVLYIGDADSAAHLGARQGLTEANAQGEFMGIQYRLVSQTEIGEMLTVPVAIITDVDASRLVQLADQYQYLPLFNLTAKDLSLREDCIPNLLHVGPSEAMLRDAERQWRQHAPDSSARARAWHRSFRKYAAAQLNIRFKEQFKLAMDDDAWAGWAAMKLLADTMVRQPSLAGEQLIAELKINLAFDGQKGRDMGFRETGQLRQPLLLVEMDKIIGEAPVRGVVDSSDLDSLGLPFCPK